MKIINPATEEIIADIQIDDKTSIDDKLKRLKTGQKKWAALPVNERLDRIVSFGGLVKENINELASVLTSETGKPLQQSFNEISGAQNRIDHLKSNAVKWLREELIVDGDTSEKIVYEPLGVVGNISAWNFPYNVGYNVFLYALAGGNAVLYKPSEFATLTGMKFRKLLWDAGVPSDVFECAIGEGDVGNILLEADLDAYFFTGSYKTGKYIAEKVAPKLVPLQLELGGKDPLYVMDDVADVKQSAINAAEGAFYNNGQSCCAVERVYVHSKIYDQFLEEFIHEVKSYQIGDPVEDNTFIGPLTRAPQIDILMHQISDAVGKGAKILTGGNAIGGTGYYIEPTVLSDVNHNMLLMREESFGPIIGIQKVASDEEALALMQDTEYGLTSAVFSSDQSRAENVLSQLNSGTAYWNCCDRVSPNVPWSGRKNSGVGSTLSYQGIRAFVQAKAYHLRA
jgi:acyl-CoA reductase-like NAD-dependent aldehyde dehydrogenase